MPRKKRTPLDVSQTTELWYCAVRRLRGWTQDSRGFFFRPFLFAAVHMNRNLVLAMDILREYPAVQEVKKKIYKTMLKPSKSAQVPAHRPAEIYLEDKNLVDALAPLLGEVQVGVRYKPLREPLDELVSTLEKQLFADQEDIPGLLMQPGVTVRQCKGLFDAATKFFTAQPWQRFSNYDLLSVCVAPMKNPFYVIVMGQGGSEFGLSIYRDLNEAEKFFTVGGPDEILANHGLQVLLFNNSPDISIADMDAAEQYGWQVPAPNYFPTPVIYMDNAIRRPGTSMLHWYEGALRAIPEFAAQCLPSKLEKTSDPIRADIQVVTSKGYTNVHLEYPAADLSAYENSMEEDWDLDYLVEGEEWVDENHAGQPAQEGSFLGLGGIERELAELGTGGSGMIPANPDLRQAQQLIYEAWEAADSRQRIDLARRALRISSDCADAYVLLANEEARTKQQALELFQAGVAAGRRALGEAFLNDSQAVGHFWGILETRPYLRALEGLASLQWLMGQRDSAEENYRELLRLNPNDNQAIRYQLLQLLMEQDRFEDAGKLIDQYEQDASTDWLYTRALMLFCKQGASQGASRVLDEALEFNPFVPAYLTGRKRLKSRIKSFVLLGGEDEAVQYAAIYQRAWQNTPGALDWLESITAGS